MTTPSWRADDGTRVEILDLVGGAPSERIAAMLAIHAAAFPEHGFVEQEILTDAARSPERDRLTVHQWLVLCDGEPAAYMLWDSNHARRVALVHFIAVDRPGRKIRMAGHRLSEWLCRTALHQHAVELAGQRPDTASLGLVGEAPQWKARVWTSVGFRAFDFAYAEPEDGRHWRPETLRLRPLVLLWLPPPGVDADTLGADAGPAGAAAFLLDHYRLPADHPLVAGAVGPERDRPGAGGR